MTPISYLRFNKRPPDKKPPPQNRLDVFWDEENSRLVAQLDDGTIIPVSNEGGGVSDVSDLTTTGLTEGSFLRVASGGGLEEVELVITRTAAQGPPIYPGTMSVSGVLDGGTTVFDDMTFVGMSDGFPSYQNGDGDYVGKSGGDWLLSHYASGSGWTSNEDVAHPGLVNVWIAGVEATGNPTVTGSVELIAAPAFIGQKLHVGDAVTGNGNKLFYEGVETAPDTLEFVLTGPAGVIETDTPGNYVKATHDGTSITYEPYLLIDP